MNYEFIYRGLSMATLNRIWLPVCSFFLFKNARTYIPRQRKDLTLSLQKIFLHFFLFYIEMTTKEDLLKNRFINSLIRKKNTELGWRQN